MTNATNEYSSLVDALASAKKKEYTTGTRYFVEYSGTSSVLPSLLIGEEKNCWIVSSSLPYFGTWYDADGHRHG